MNIIELKTGIIEGMAKLVIDDLKDNEYEGTPFESMAVIESLNFSAEFYKNWFLEKKNDFNLSQEEIDDIIADCIVKTRNVFLEH